MSELEAYESYLSRLPLSVHTRRNYLLRVRQFLLWLADTPEGLKALVDQVERDFSVQDYKVRLLQSGASANTLNAALTALDNFFLFKGMGPLKVKRQDLPAAAPRALEPDEQRRLLKVVAQCKSLRNRVVALVMLHCGLRISEVAALNVADVLLSARKRELIVRCGKNSKRRIVPINKDLADVLVEYLAGQTSATPRELSATSGASVAAPLFRSQKGNRLSIQAVDYIIRQFANDAGVDFSSHNLRHSCLTRLVRAGVDLIVVAEVAGHSRLETTRRYSLPSADVKIAAMEKLNYGATTT